MDQTQTPETTQAQAEGTTTNDAMALERMTELALEAASHPAVAPPLRELVPALVALVKAQQEVITLLGG